VHHVDEIWMTFTPDDTKRHRLRTFCQKHDIRLVVFSELEPFRRFVAAAHEGEASCETEMAQNNREAVHESRHRK
jgi:diketogulonate reductase-like aldo/keto reductase